MNPPQLCIIGRSTAPWAIEARAALARAGNLHNAASLTAALGTLSAENPPELVVLLAERPGEHDPRQLLALRHRAPLTRLVAITGPWCEAENRSGLPLPGVERTAWHEWPRQLARYLADHPAGRMNLWTAPPTFSRDEAALHASTQSLPASGGLIAIAASTAIAYASLADPCRHAGYATCWLRSQAPACVDGPLALVWDAVHLGEAQLAELVAWRQLFPRLPILAVAGFPRPHDLARLRAAGAAAVLAKPLSLDALLGKLHQLTAGQNRSTSPAPLVAAA